MLGFLESESSKGNHGLKRERKKEGTVHHVIVRGRRSNLGGHILPSIVELDLPRWVCLM